MNSSSKPKKNRMSLMALEQRWVFDGAAPVDVLQKLGADEHPNLFDTSMAAKKHTLVHGGTVYQVVEPN